MKTRLIVRKGASSIDFVVGIGIFLLIFAISIQFATDYITTSQAKSDGIRLRSEAISIIDLAERSHVFNGSQIQRIGLATTVSRIQIKLNNTTPFLKNGSVTAHDELVILNFTKVGISGDFNSTAVYNESGNEVSYQINGDEIRFKSFIGSNAASVFTIWFDDDSNFTSKSTAVSAEDNLSETILSVEKVRLVQYRNIIRLDSVPYDSVRNTTEFKNNFRIAITDLANQTFFEYGANLPGAADIVAIQKPVIFQNSTAGIKSGWLRVYVMV